ncbi:DinB family protein [Planococcus sp. CPCC 101016]|uniref:DinB family protein n=1 Tax=Planococcus sp. CPCC 101016 TaxID=2599617 RepID=UPI0011B79232|nr:DinB family protein [Planococcus sp. CPCC 101016]TWT07978.1 DinB family protein [Planococcus sp. CPCC 101016]
MVDYRVRTTRAYSEKIGELVAMLNYTRQTTLSEIAGLTQAELDHLPEKNSNSIASLLLHIAAIEFVHQIISNENRDLTEHEYKKWSIALELGDRARAKLTNLTLEHCLHELQQVRGDTLNLLKSKQDAWLYKENKWDNGISYNNYYLWFHVLEEEISHRGQIKAIIRVMRSKK